MAIDHSGDQAWRAADRAARESYGRLLAFLAARTRDVAGAEDALADAFASALKQWPLSGVPDNPEAWLLTAARHRQTDAIRRGQTRTAARDHLQMMADEIGDETGNSPHIPDRRLALMFACAHPAIGQGMRAPLILQAVLGLTAEQISGAFLIPPATMGQRLVRAKSQIKAANIPFEVPDKEDLPDRLDAVLTAIYAAYTKGWSELDGADTSAFAEEAIWLGEMTASLLPDEPEAKGLLALMLYTEARRAARRDAEGAYVPLAEQDTGLWDRDMLDAAEKLLNRASADGPSGRLQLEAAVQSAHIARRLTGADTWPAIVALYDLLFDITASPVVALNRAVAIAETEGPATALGLLHKLAADQRLTSYQPYWAARGHVAAGAGDIEDAHEALTIAIGLCADPAERRYLVERRDKLRQG